MRRTLVFACAVTLLSAVSAQAQIGSPGIEYSNTIAGGDGVQMYPYDQQDPWLHGHFQRYPAYGGFSSFRPYNYRHVFSQTQIATGWGATHGMPYSQQFWNKYRGSYLNGNLHSQTAASEGYPMLPPVQGTYPIYPASSVRPIAYVPVATQDSTASAISSQPTARPVHVFPGE